MNTEEQWDTWVQERIRIRKWRDTHSIETGEPNRVAQKHGVTAYKQGRCRCDQCREAASEYQRAFRARRRDRAS